MPTTPRPISRQEIAVIRAAIEKAPAQGCLPAAMEAIPSLVVVGSCACGCPSVDFLESAAYVRGAGQIGDAVGRTAGGGLVGVIVWGAPDAVLGLEIYSLGEEVADFPLPESIVPFDQGDG